MSDETYSPSKGKQIQCGASNMGEPHCVPLPITRSEGFFDGLGGVDNFISPQDYYRFISN